MLGGAGRLGRPEPRGDRRTNRRVDGRHRLVDGVSLFPVWRRRRLASQIGQHQPAAWTSPRLDGQLYGEPLVFGPWIYVASENNTVYALVDHTGKVAWSRHLGSPVPASALPCSGISPTVGITGTPVIDSARKEIFVVADLYVNHKPQHHLIGLSTATGKVELSVDVDPSGSYPPALLQHTGLNLDAGQVIFAMGGNNGDCSTYRGRVVAVPEKGGKPRFFTVDAARGDSQGAIWMGGAAPVVDSKGHIWAEAGTVRWSRPARPMTTATRCSNSRRR